MMHAGFGICCAVTSNFCEHLSGPVVVARFRAMRIAQRLGSTNENERVALHYCDVEPNEIGPIRETSLILAP